MQAFFVGGYKKKFSRKESFRGKIERSILDSILI